MCAEPGCPGYAAYRGRCVFHARRHERISHPLANQAVYNSKRWQVLREAQLSAEPLCQWFAGCGKIASDVDHIRPLQEGGNPYDPANVQSLCGSHHAMKTRREQLRRQIRA